MERVVTPGSLWFVISMTWIQAFHRYLYLDHVSGNPQDDLRESDRVHPGPILNEDILIKIPVKQYLLEKLPIKLW